MMATTLEVTPDTTADDLRAAITNLSATAHRYPSYDRRQDGWHAEINRLLELLDGPA